MGPAANVTDTALAAAAAGNDTELSAGLARLSAAVASRAGEALTQAIGQPVRFGAAEVRAAAPGEPENENLDLFHPVDVLWEVAGTAYSALLLLPKVELQAVLPAARGSADLPDMEALGALLRGLADQISERLAAMVPVRITLADAGAGAGHTPDHDQPQMRVEHTVSVGQVGAETVLTVVHLIPTAALQSVASRLATAPSEAGADVRATSQTAMHPETGTTLGGETRTMEEQMAAGQQAAGTSVHPVQFQPFDGDIDVQGGTNLDLLLDVNLKVSVELGRTDLTIKDVLALGPGSVVELDKLAGEPVDILVNDHLIAKGEVVVVDENFGVRVTDIVSPQKRIGKLR